MREVFAKVHTSRTVGSKKVVRQSPPHGPRVLLLLAALCTLSGCGLFAAPCRVASAGLKIVPLVGQVAAAPTDGCANVIDPTPTKS